MVALIRASVHTGYVIIALNRFRIKFILLNILSVFLKAYIYIIK